nr:hypothetical protein [uncultured Agathobaculum sp.]
MKVWVYGRSRRDIRAMSAYCADNADTMIGFSMQKGGASFFPHAGLTPPMQAAIRGELDQLLLSDLTLLGNSAEQIREQEAAFRSYQVCIKSACSWGSSNS